LSVGKDLILNYEQITSVDVLISRLENLKKQ